MPPGRHRRPRSGSRASGRRRHAGGRGSPRSARRGMRRRPSMGASKRDGVMVGTRRASHTRPTSGCLQSADRGTGQRGEHRRMRRIQLGIVPAVVIALATVAAPPPIARAAEVPVSINDSGGATNTLVVTVTVGAVPGATTMLVSSGGGLEQELPYATSFSWDLGDPPYGRSAQPGREGVRGGGA